MSKEIEQTGQLPIGLPNDIPLLKEMLRWEKIGGDREMVVAMEKQLKELLEKRI